MTDTSKLRWGIVGPGKIARDFRDGAAGSATGEIVALGSRRPDQARLAADFPGARIHGSYEALIADPAMDAIYIATPHPYHAPWAIAAAGAGKHVLSEKPMGISQAEVAAMFAAAGAAGTFMGEAYMYRHHPLTEAIVDLIASGMIGEVRMIRSAFGFDYPDPPPGHRLFSKHLGGGGILDVGGYPVSMARLIAGIGHPDGLLEPDGIEARAHIGATGTERPIPGPGIDAAVQTAARNSQGC